MKTYQEFLLEKTIANASGHRNTQTDNLQTDTSSLVPNIVKFKTLNRMEIITVVSLMLDSINQEYMKQHNGLSLWGTGSVLRKLSSM